MMKKYGHIFEETYNHIGFPKDTNYEGKLVEKPDQINQEMRHRAKIISHQLQCKLRRKKEVDAVNIIKQKENNELILKNELIKLNSKAERKLLSSSEHENLHEMTIENFYSCKVDELKAFIHCRLFTTGTIVGKEQRSMMPTKKGKVADAKDGEVNNLMRVGYEKRMDPILIIPPDVDDDGNVVLVDVVMDDVDDDDVGVEEVVVAENDDECPHRLIVELSTTTPVPIVTPPRSRLISNHPPSFYINSDYLALAQANIRGTYNIAYSSPNKENRQ